LRLQRKPHRSLPSRQLPFRFRKLPRSWMPRFPPSRLSPRQLRLKARRQRLRPRQRLLFAAWSCRRPDLGLYTRRPFCRQQNPARATWLQVLDCSAEGPSSIAVLLALRAAIRRALPVAALRLPANSRADHAPSIPHAHPWAVPEPPAHPERAQALALVPDLAHQECVPASAHAPAAQVVLHQQARLPVRSVLHRAVAEDVRSTPRPKKAR
jgi:hypothetical protein